MKGEYYHTKESVTEYIQLAKDVNGQELIDKLKNYLADESNLLELGSGPGSDWEILAKDYNTTGSDNSQEFLSRLKLKYPAGKFIELDAITLDVNEKFDEIYSNKVMHHLNSDELKESISRQFEILNPKGIICHSFWKGSGSEVFKGLFVQYHNEESLTGLFQEKFDVLLLESYAEFEDNDSLLLIAKRK